MRFQQENKFSKTLLVISDLHLSAGTLFKGKRNFLEDFHFDKELVEFLEYYSTGIYAEREVELVINGDFLDFLAVPYVDYYDDEFWSEEAAHAKLKHILGAHAEVFEALNGFLAHGNKKIVYIVGNHDAEFVFPSMREAFAECFDEEVKKRFSFLLTENFYKPSPGIYIKHGHEYEKAHHFDEKSSIIETAAGTKYFIPPWGSYYVTRVVNKFKAERTYVNQVRPVRSFIINGLIYDPLFTLRFMFATFYYLVMVRFVTFFYQKRSIKEKFHELQKEFELFKDYEHITRTCFEENPEMRVLIVGHTHEPTFRIYGDGSMFLNTGTWTKMVNLDFAKMQGGAVLTYAQIDITPLEREKLVDGPPFEVSLNTWKGNREHPYMEFH